MIGFNLTEEQKEMQAFFRKFSQERVKAAAEKMDEEEKMDMDLIHEMQSLVCLAFHSQKKLAVQDLMFSTMFF